MTYTDLLITVLEKMAMDVEGERELHSIVA
jgi:hypothetical protein